jgi:hypothetical protein
MEVIINVGLAVGTNGNIGFGTVLRELAQAGFTVRRYNLLHSETEPTIVARAVFPGNDTHLHRMAAAVALLLSQDCIAVYVPTTGNGFLAGPRAAAWGVFDPTQFILPDGTRLAPTPLARAA